MAHMEYHIHSQKGVSIVLYSLPEVQAPRNPVMLEWHPMVAIISISLIKAFKSSPFAFPTE